MLLIVFGVEIMAAATIYYLVLETLAPPCTCPRRVTRQSGEGQGHVVSCLARAI